MARPPAEFDLVIFDCDGVLIDSEVLSCGCLAALLCQRGFEMTVERTYELFLGRSFSAVEEQYHQAMGRPLDPDFAPEYRARLREWFARDLRAMPGVQAALSRVFAPVCVASSSDSDRLSFSLAHTGLATLFGEHVYSSNQVKHGKPAPDLFLHAAERMGADPRRTLVIEDSLNGILAARAANMTVWGFVGGSHYAGRDGSRLLSDAGASRIVRSMSELPPL